MEARESDGLLAKGQRAAENIPNWPFIPFIVLLTFDYVKDDLEVFLMYFTSANTSYGCSFSEAYGIYLYCNAILMVAVQPLLAWVTDKYGDYSSLLMWTSLFIELVVEVLMFVIPNLPFWVLLMLQLIRSIALCQNTIAIWKVFKQKLTVTVGDDPLVHEKIINFAAMWGICGEVTLDVYIFGSGYLLSGPGGFGFPLLSWYVYLVTAGTTFLAVVVAFFYITPSYVHQHASLNRSNVQINQWDGEEGRDRSVEKANRWLTFFHCISLGVEKHADGEERKGFLAFLAYFRDGALHLYRNEVARGGIIHATLVCLMWKLMASGEPLQLAELNTDSTVDPTVENLCAGEFENLFYQYAWNNIFYVLGAIIYIVFLVRVLPLRYFSVFYPACGLFFAVCMVPLLFDLPYFLQVLFAAVVGVLPWFLYRYDTYLITAACDEEFVGIATGVIGYIRYISPALPGIILAFDLEFLIIALAYVFLFSSIVFSLLYVFLFRKQFLAFEHRKDSDGS